jgi:FAD/FMN-containing dehydrogenase
VDILGALDPEASDAAIVAPSASVARPQELPMPEPVTSAALSALRASASRLDGSLVLEGMVGWDEARSVWNGLIDRHPVAVIRAASLDDVALGIGIARDHALPLAVRGGGHNVAGNGTVDDGLVIDLGSMHGVRVDPATRTVLVQGGATLADLDRATIGHGLVVPAGVVSGTGIAGLTLGGGMGWLTRAHGLSIDQLVGATVVTAAGGRVHASADEEPELFWGLRGGGGNFGVVTELEFRARRLPAEVLAGATFYRQERWSAALAFYAAWAATIPDELTTIVTWLTPPDEWLPPSLQGLPMLALSFCWAGSDLAAGQRAVADLVAADPSPDHVAVGPTPWLELQSSADAGFPRGIHAYFKSTYLDDLDAATIATLVEHAARRRSPMAGTDIHQLGGRFAQVPADATAFGRRDPGYILNVWGIWRDAADDAHEIAWVRDFWSGMQAHSRGGHYVNFLGLEEGRELRSQTRQSYSPEAWARLVALKRRWDPGNLFRLNHNIPPGD